MEFEEIAEDIKSEIYWEIDRLEKLDKDMNHLKTLSIKFADVIDVLYENGFFIDNEASAEPIEFLIIISHENANSIKYRKCIDNVKVLESLFAKEDLVDYLKKELEIK